MYYNKKKRLIIGHFLHSLGMGGMENGVVKLVNSSTGNQFRHIIITLTNDHFLKSRITNPNVKIIAIGKRTFFANISKLYHILKNEKITILHARGWPTMVETAMMRFFLPDIRIIFGFHGRAFYELGKVNIKKSVAQIVLSRLFHKITTLTSSMRTEIADEFMISHDKIKVIQNGVPANPYHRKIGIELKRALNIDEGEFVIGFTGRIDRVKRIDLILNAFETFYIKNGSGYLVIVGDGEFFSELKSYSLTLTSKDRILFTGHSDDVFAFYNIFDIYVQASDYEGLSNTILEAMSCSLPVICTDVGGNSDVITSGVNGFLVRKGDFKHIAEKIIILHEKNVLRECMQQASLRMHHDRYSILKMVQSYENLYLSLSRGC